MTKPKYFITDVFTTKRYGGNPLATFIDCESLSTLEMQQIAKEINFSETTFISSRQPRDGGYDVRIFTPNAEVEFAGHPTLGTAYVLREKLRLTSEKEVVLNLRIGRIPVTFVETPNHVPLLWMRQMPPTFGKQVETQVEINRMARVLGLAATDFDQDFPIQEVSTGFPTLVVPLANLSAQKRIKINKEEYFALVKDAWAKIILVYSREAYEPGQDISVRVFADFYGVAEDAATGSSNGALAAYLVQHMVFGEAAIECMVGQGYELGRPSAIALRARDSHGVIDVSVGGSVVEVAEGVWG